MIVDSGDKQAGETAQYLQGNEKSIKEGLRCFQQPTH